MMGLLGFLDRCSFLKRFLWILLLPVRVFWALDFLGLSIAIQEPFEGLFEPFGVL